MKNIRKFLRIQLVLIWLVLFCPSGKCEVEYDFIVVGGGTSGAAVTRRLAEKDNFTVLLIEAGQFPTDANSIPANAPYFLSDPEVTFQYFTVPQKYAGLQNGGIIAPIAGRILGGGSALNYMWFNRGNPRDFDNFANTTGDESWNYSNMLEHFKKSETYAGDFPSDQHGDNGPITVSRPKYAPGLDIWLAAGRYLGYPSPRDPNGPQQISFGPVEFSKKFGRRVSSYTGYLKPIMGQGNLHVVVHTNVTQIVFKGNRAIGVRYKTKSKDVGIFYAKKEIILCAGVYESPLLLQRSGVGPKDLLKSAGIPIVKDLPVGSNFHDHVALPIQITIRDKSAVINEERDLTPETFQYYNTYGDGPYSNVRGGTGQAFVASSVATAEGEKDWPDLHLCMAHSTEPYLAANVISNSSSASIDSDEVPMSASVFMMRGKSRGSIFINSKDPWGPPVLDVGYFTEQSDMDRMLYAVKETIRIFEQTPPYKRIGARILTSGMEECGDPKIDSDAFWVCYIKALSQAGLHAGGTCRMGKGPEDPEAVVDSKLRVIGVKGLRVADASIMPFQTNANPQAAIYGIAEKVSTMILKDWTTK